MNQNLPMFISLLQLWFDFVLSCHLLPTFMLTLFRKNVLNIIIVFIKECPKLPYFPIKAHNLFGGVGAGEFRPEAVLAASALKKVVVPSICWIQKHRGVWQLVVPEMKIVAWCDWWCCC